MDTMLIDTSCFIHEIPLNIQRVVCCQLDQNDRWRQLARAINYDKSAIDQIKQSTSPATKLLSMWSDQNHTVTELFMAFYRVKEFRLMEYLRDLVDSKYHRLIASKSSSFSALKAQVAQAIKHYKHRKSVSSTKSEGFRTKSALNPFEVTCVGIPKIAFGELTQATSQWNENNILGAGGFGTVYRGKWKCTEVAIKRINYSRYDKNPTTTRHIKEIMIEMQYLNAYRHDNILPLYGYSFDGSSACLVYQMMACGSLEIRLRQKKLPLSHKQRLDIAIGTARGLHFLHTFEKRPTVHGDIKSANILLDSNLQPKIGDFGLACHSNGQLKSKRIYGTHGYLAEDFITNLTISTKNDVWAFGVVLFELATSLRSWDERRGTFHKLSHYMWAFSESPERYNDVIEANVKTISKESLLLRRKLIHIGLSCTKPLSTDRPDMPTILNSLLEIS